MAAPLFTSSLFVPGFLYFVYQNDESKANFQSIPTDTDAVQEQEAQTNPQLAVLVNNSSRYGGVAFCNSDSRPTFFITVQAFELLPSCLFLISRIQSNSQNQTQIKSAMVFSVFRNFLMVRHIYM